MILVTLGTHPQPMDRLVKAIDDLVEDGSISESVVIQAARFDRRPSYAEGVGIASYQGLVDLARSASVIVTHGGPGSIVLALGAGRRPIVVPRQAKFGEHVDDHQLRFARWIAPRRGLRIVEDVADLGQAIEGARRDAAISTPAGPSADVLERLRLVIERPAFQVGPTQR